MVWDPTAGHLHLEWPVKLQGGQLLSLPDDAAAAGFTSTGTETVDGLHLDLDRIVGAPTLAVEVFPKADLPHSITTDTFRPNADEEATAVKDETGDTAAGTLYESVDEATLDTADFIETTGATTAVWGARYGTAAVTGTITQLRVVVVCQHKTSGAEQEISAEVEDKSAGVTDRADSVTVAGVDGQVRLEFAWDKSPFTGNLWTSTEVENFNSTTDTNRVLLRGLSGTAGVRFYQVFMEVDTVVAPAAKGEITPTGGGWANVPFDTAWSKAAGDFVALVRKTNSAGQAVWVGLDADEACPHASWVSYAPAVDNAAVTDLGASRTLTHAVVLEVAGSSSADSQPYSALNLEAAYSGRTVEQEVTGDGTAVRWVSLVAAQQAGQAGAPLDVKVRLRSDDTVQASATVSALADRPTLARRVDAVLNADATLTAGTQYYVELSTTAGDGAGWQVAVADSQTAPVSADADGAGGTTDAATVGGVEDTSTDVPLQVASAPAAPTGLSATAGARSVSLSWTATALGADFGEYRLLRGGELIATVTAESTTTFEDFEVRQGVQETYVIQVVDVDGPVSPESAAATATVAASDTQWWLSTNADSTLNVDVQDHGVGGDRTYRFPADYQIIELLGRDNAVAHRGLDDRGDAFEIGALRRQSELSAVDRDMYDSLLELARGADTVAVCSPHGRRWFASLRIPQAQNMGSIETIGSATVQVRETSDTPDPVTVP